MDEEPSAVKGPVGDAPDDPDASTDVDAGSDADPTATESTETATTETEEPPGPDPQEPVSEEDRPGAGEGESGSPGKVPERTDERTAPDGIPQTTTTGDPDKDVGGPSVAEESRRQMEGDQALDKPGYGDLGHAEDFRILRDD